MRKLSKKAKRLIIDFSSAAADLTNKAIRPNFIQFGEARAALMDYIAELESLVERLIEAGDSLSDSLCTYPEEDKTIEVMNWNAIVAEYEECEK